MRSALVMLKSNLHRSDRMEKFKCPDCGFEILVEFSETENKRDVPCGGCYYETFEYNSDKQETNKNTFGALINCEKGKGI